MKRIFLASIIVAPLMSGFAYAQEAVQPFSGTVGLVSQYTFRGLAQSDKNPAIQGLADFMLAYGDRMLILAMVMKPALRLIYTGDGEKS